MCVDGVAERAIPSVQHQARVLKLALENKWNMVISHKHSLRQIIPGVLAESFRSGSRRKNGR